eukprot:TRINITY_DN33695_c0_g1_i1.p1 TRINITY_DN33695_c0_g1~~TRINITY_DN33695_c0_g1_i1.p1  ORF type:complete len:686 (+),score=123.78 TRINITY_DN33695_c0_g1_i1:102-2159(+)
MIRRPPRSPLSSSSAASDVYKRQGKHSRRDRSRSSDRRRRRDREGADGEDSKHIRRDSAPEEPAMATGSGMPGCDAILVFLPGVKEIQTLQDTLLRSRKFEGSREWVLPLHGGLPSEEQRRVFQRPPPGVRKVVLATNVAETSITIDDIGFVLDTCRMKETRYDPSRRLSSLEDVLVSQANAKQRRGRAGRVPPGVCVHLCTRHTFECVAMEHQAPEVKRVPLEQLVLRIHSLQIPGKASEVCKRLLEPPSTEAVDRAVEELISIGALSAELELTSLGTHLSQLPVDPRVGKLLLVGAAFGPAAANHALTVAASLASRNPFMSPMDKREEADRAKAKFVHSALGPSDHVIVLNAYDAWDRLQGEEKFRFCREHFLGLRSMQAIAGLKRQLLEILSDAGFVRSGLHARHVERAGMRDDSDGVRTVLLGEQAARDREDPATHQALVSALLCAALFPQVISVEQQPPSKKKASTGERPPPKFFIRECGASEPVPVAIHPSSVLSKVKGCASPYLVYHELVRTTKLYVRDATPVSPLALVLFGGRLKAGTRPDRSGETVLTIDGWVKFTVPVQLQSLLVETRAQIDAIFKRKIEDPFCDFAAGESLLSAVVGLLADASLLPPAEPERTPVRAQPQQRKQLMNLDQRMQSFSAQMQGAQAASLGQPPPPPPSRISSWGSGWKPSFVPGFR